MLKRVFMTAVAAFLCVACLASCSKNETPAAESEDKTDLAQQEQEIEKTDNEENADIVLPTEAVDYSDMSNWAYYNHGEDKPADLFIVCPTVDMGDKGNYIADITDEKYRERFVGALNMELGIYSDVSSVYAPFYRQGSFLILDLEDEEYEQCMESAYRDVRDAFLYFAENTDDTRPLILAGFSQGSDMVIRLMKDLFDDEKYRKRLVAAYCIGWDLTEEDVKEYPQLVPAAGESDTGVIITFNTEAPEVTSSFVVSEGEKTYSINPINWRTDTVVADKKDNEGACFTDYSGSITEEIHMLTGAYIDSTRGTLKVTDIDMADYPASLFEDGVYHLYDYQFFYRNLQENVAVRLDTFLKYQTVSFEGEPPIPGAYYIIYDDILLLPIEAVLLEAGYDTDYYEITEDTGVFTAHRGNDSVLLNVGEEIISYNGGTISLELPSYYLEDTVYASANAVCEIIGADATFDDNSDNVTLNVPKGYYGVSYESVYGYHENQEGQCLVEASVTYPVIDNYDNNPFIDELNEDYRWEADKFIEEAMLFAPEAQMIYDQMENGFVPFDFSLTFTEDYNEEGLLTFTKHIYANLGGAHPSTILESRSYDMENQTELSLSMFIDENALEDGLAEYVYDIFAEKLAEMELPEDEQGGYEILEKELGSVQYYPTEEGLVLYFNSEVIAPFALGIISVEIPYNPDFFLVDLQG